MGQLLSLLAKNAAAEIPPAFVKGVETLGSERHGSPGGDPDYFTGQPARGLGGVAHRRLTLLGRESRLGGSRRQAGGAVKVGGVGEWGLKKKINLRNYKIKNNLSVNYSFFFSR